MKKINYCLIAGTLLFFSCQKEQSSIIIASNQKSQSSSSLVTQPLGSSRQGVTVAGGNGAGNAANQLNDPCSVFVDGDDNIYVADQWNARVIKFAPGSSNGVTIGANLPNAPGFPTDVYVCPRTGAVYVADYFSSRVVRLS